MSARLGRVHLRVATLDRAIAFYTKVLGLRVTHREQGVAFLAAGDGRHELALHAQDARAPRPPLWLGCCFVGFEVPSKGALAKSCARLGGARATIVATRDSWAVHTTDPDGNGVEIYWLTPDPFRTGDTVRTLSLADLEAAAETEQIAETVGRM
jgi:catechol 2,3-dioxygenase